MHLVPSNASNEAWLPLLNLVVDAVSSQESRRAYARGLRQFFRWMETNDLPFCRATVQRYRTALEQGKYAPSSINQSLAAIRKLASEAGHARLLPHDVVSGVLAVKGIPQRGRRLGRWLDRDGASQMLNQPAASRLKGLRDRAILAVLIGAGLRRAEACRLRVDSLQQRDGRWILADIEGKGHRVRSVPISLWTKRAIDAWLGGAQIKEGFIFRAMDKRGRITRQSLSAQAIYEIVSEHSDALGSPVAPHDLRRTFARLAYRGRAAIDQIQASLGHASIATTERYLGAEQSLEDPPCDHLGIESETQK